jgi:hypothetical protein
MNRSFANLDDIAGLDFPRGLDEFVIHPHLAQLHLLGSQCARFVHADAPKEFIDSHPAKLLSACDSALCDFHGALPLASI